MKKYILAVLVLLILLVSCKISEGIKSSNRKPKPFNGKITFEVVTTIENEERFDKELSNYIKLRDSLYKLKHPKDTIWANTNAPTLRLMLDPREDPRQGNPYFNPLQFKYQFSDTLVSYNFKSGFTTYRVEINIRTQDYIRYNLKTNKIVKTNKYQFYTNHQPYKEIIYKDSIKKILGFECYKVVVIDDYLDDDLKELKTYKEMYVTENINSRYHPLQIRKELIEKYYPLEVKLYSDFLSDKETYYRVRSIE